MANIKIPTPYAHYLISEFDRQEEKDNDKKISVNPVVSEVATWYEKLRNAMDYREDDVILRAAIERILKRRILLGGTGTSISEPLVRELIWARYFPDETVPESIVQKVENIINLHSSLSEKIEQAHSGFSKAELNTWIMQLMSSEIEHLLSPNREKQLLINFMYQVFRNNVSLLDDTEQTRDAQVFIAVRRAFAKEDQALLRYHLFTQLFGQLAPHNLDHIAQNFLKGKKEIEHQLTYFLKDRIYTFIKKQTVPFFILEDILGTHKGKNLELMTNEEQFKLAILNSCAFRYKDIRAKVNRAIIRGVIFLLITKAIFGLAVEGSFESFFYGRVQWKSIAINIAFPPILMIIVGALIKTPDRENSIKILDKINKIIFETHNMGNTLILRKNSNHTSPLLNAIFVTLWLLAIVLSVSAIVYVLTALDFSPISQLVFLFFLAIVSFIAFRVNQTAHMYTISDDKQSLKSLAFDFFFMPFIHLGRQLTENISKINIILFVFDLIIETPFKEIFSFFEQWFLFLRTQREKLG